MNSKIKYYCYTLGQAFDAESWQLSDMSDGNGPFISQWNLPIPQPTPEQLAAITDEQVAAYEKEVREASFVEFGLAPVASVFRATLRSVTGDPNAETNHGITRDTIFGLYFGIAAQRPLTLEELRQKDILQNGFMVLSAWVNEDPPNTWSVPWGIVP